MPRGPKGEKRPADVIGAAVMVGRIATGEIEEGTEPETKAAAALGRRGGKARVSCTRFRRHQVRCFMEQEGASWREGSLRGSSSLRLSD
jgi:hypothetical protein